jgi:hypothetical protein
MITTITPLRRVAVTLVLTGATVFGAVSIAPAAFADEGSSVSQADNAQGTGNGNAYGNGNGSAPEVVVPEAPPVVAPAPAPVDPAPVAQAPATTPVVVTPPEVVVGKDGKPVKAPKACTAKDLSEQAAAVAKANAQAASIKANAASLRKVAALLRAQAAKLTYSQARVVLALASLSDYAANALDAQAANVVAKVAPLSCIVVAAPSDRF